MAAVILWRAVLAVLVGWFLNPEGDFSLLLGGVNGSIFTYRLFLGYIDVLNYTVQLNRCILYGTFA